MEFKKYQHIERYGTSEVAEIDIGTCYIFPKIDGTNASVWLDNNGVIRAGSRNRQLKINKDNAGFYAWVKEQPNIYNYLKAHPDHRLFGEWLVPHSLKTYRDDAWKHFYIFDVAVDSLEDGRTVYLDYDSYKHELDNFNLPYIQPIAIINNPTAEQLYSLLEKNTFLIEDGKGVGEGIVIKNYEYRNKYGRNTFAKIVRSEFKDLHHRTMGTPKIKGKKCVEEDIAKKYVTLALCEKTMAKIELDNNGFSGKNIPELLNRVYHDIIVEESWNIVNGFKNPTINYKKLMSFVFREVKLKLKL